MPPPLAINSPLSLYGPSRMLTPAADMPMKGPGNGIRLDRSLFHLADLIYRFNDPISHFAVLISRSYELVSIQRLWWSPRFTRAPNRRFHFLVNYDEQSLQDGDLNTAWYLFFIELTLGPF